MKILTSRLSSLQHPSLPPLLFSPLLDHLPISWLGGLIPAGCSFVSGVFSLVNDNVCDLSPLTLLI